MIRAVLIFLSALCFSAPAFAQISAAPEKTEKTEKSVRLPVDVPPLPDGSTEQSYAVINSANVSLYHEILPAPVAGWVRSGKAALRIAKQTQIDWHYDDLWEQGTLTADAHYKLNQQNELEHVAGSEGERGFPFGRSEIIDREPDPVRRAYKILWNLVSTEQIAPELLYGVGLSWFSDRALLRKSNGMFYRRAFPENNQENLLRQELFRLISPPVVFGYASLIWQYRGPTEDQMWMYSPVTGHSRALLISNRSDSILDGVLAFEDLNAWLTKPSLVDAEVIEDRVLLVPSATQSEQRLADEAQPDAADAKNAEPSVLSLRGRYRDQAQLSSMVLWNQQTHFAPEAAAWSPSSPIFIPRYVWVIEIHPRDPYSSSGRQVLVVDKESMLPVYKIVYDPKGNYLKTLVSGWSLAASADNQQRFPFLGFVLGVEKDGERANALGTDYVKVFLNDQSPIVQSTRALLSIEAHGEKHDSAPAAAPAQP